MPNTFHSCRDVPLITLYARDVTAQKYVTLLDKVDTLRYFDNAVSSNKADVYQEFELAVIGKNLLHFIKKGLIAEQWDSFYIVTDEKWKNEKTGKYEEDKFQYAVMDTLTVSYVVNADGDPASFKFRLSQTNHREYHTF